MLSNETIEDLNIESSRNKFEYLSRSPQCDYFRSEKAWFYFIFIPTQRRRASLGTKCEVFFVISNA